MMYVFLGALGLVFGSFVTALVDRLRDGRDWVKGRSECDSCHKELTAQDLIPVISWLANRGKCRQCQQPISWQYPVIELTTALLFIISYRCWPYELAGAEILFFAGWLALIVGFVTLSVYDIRWLILPNKILYPLIGLMLAMTLFRAIFLDGGAETIRDAVLGLMALGGLFYGLFQISSGRWIGGGDVKLGFLLGLLVAGVYKAFLVMFIASLIGLVISLPLLISKKLNPKSHIPFGPILMLAGITVFLRGQAMIDWYLGNLI